MQHGTTNELKIHKFFWISGVMNSLSCLKKFFYPVADHGHENRSLTCLGILQSALFLLLDMRPSEAFAENEVLPALKYSPQRGVFGYGVALEPVML